MPPNEGLSYSDYFDDQVPYEVKPVPSVTPMEEVQQYKPDVSEMGMDGWLDKHGNYYTLDIDRMHVTWAKKYLTLNRIPYYVDDVYEKMFELGFVRVKVKTFIKIVYIENELPPTP